MTKEIKKFSCWCAALALALAVVVPVRAAAQDQQDDPPSRVARLGYLQGSVSFQPAGETDWVGAVPNRPMTTGDQLWTDQDSRAEVQLGSAVIRLAANTGFSFLNLDDNTIQIQLTSGAVNITVRRLGNDDDFEVDTPNQAFTAFQPGHYRLEVSPDGSYTAISVREGEGEATGNGQTYTLRGGQRGTFSGTDSLDAEVIPIYGPDDFDTWCEGRDHRYDYSRSAQYLSHDVVGYEDLDDYGDWRDDSNYGHIWFPNQVAVGWAPYHQGHWDWISPWGWTWVDDSSWGYAPFHYGRWVSAGGRWGWIAGPVAVQPVYAPALVVFIGAGGAGFGGNVGWFALGPRDVYVPSYHVSEAYVNRVNISNTTVNITTVTNVYHTTIINNSTTITNITYVNRNVAGAVMAVPQQAFVSAQPVAKVAVVVSARDIAAAPVSGRAAMVPTRQSVLGAKAATANHVAAPPAAVANRQVIAKKTPPPPPVPFAKQQQALAAHPGQPLARSEVRTLRPATAEARPMVKQAPPGKPATPSAARTGNQPGNQPAPARPAQPAAAPSANQPPKNQPSPNQPINRPANQPASNGRPAVAPPAQPNRPPSTTPNQPATSNRPETMRPAAPQPDNRPEPSEQAAPPVRNDRPNEQPNDRPTTAQPSNRPQPNPPAPNRSEPAPRTQTPAPSDRAQPRTPPPAAKPAPATPPREQAKPQTPEQKKQEEERQKREQEKPQGD
jgi:hypothetical protein